MSGHPDQPAKVALIRAQIAGMIEHSEADSLATFSLLGFPRKLTVASKGSSTNTAIYFSKKLANFIQL